MPAKPGFLLRFTARTVFALSASDHERDVGLRHLGIDFIHLDQRRVGDVRFGEQHVHVSRHPAGHGMNREFDGDAAFGQRVVQLAHLVLRLRHRHAVSRDDDDVARLLQQLRRAFDSLLLPLFLLTLERRRLRFPERTE